MYDGRVGKFLLNVQSSISENKGKKHILEITILTIKSLLPSEEEVATRVDYERFRKEMELWLYYRNGDNVSLLNSFGKPNGDIYFLESDDSVNIRISPIVLANSKWNVVREEVLKNILYSTGNISTLLEGLLLAKILFCTFNKSEKTLEEAKEEIINLSQTSFLDVYKNYFKVSINNYPGNFYGLCFMRLAITLQIWFSIVPMFL